AGRRRLMRRSPSRFGVDDATRPVGSTTCARFASAVGTARSSAPLRWSSALARSSARNRAAVWMSFSRRAWWIVTSTTPPSVGATPPTRPAGSVMRPGTARGRRMSPAGGVEPVPRAADRLDGAPLERLVDLLAEVPHVDLHDVRVTIEGEVPHVVEDLGLRDDLP